MQHTRTRAFTGPLAIVLGFGLSLSCSSGGGSSSPSPGAKLPDFTAATFTNSTAIVHTLAPWRQNVRTTYVGDEEGEPSIVVVERIPGTRMVLNTECIAVQRQTFVDELLEEDSTTWFAQDDAGNVWTMGEDLVTYEYDDEGQVIDMSTEGSWEAGLDPLGNGSVAQPGYLVSADPRVGDYYFQEHSPGVAMDRRRVLELAEQVTLENGQVFTCVKFEVSSPLEPGERTFEYWSPGFGFVRERDQPAQASAELRGQFDLGSASLPSFAAAAFTNPDELTHPHFLSPVGIARVYIERDGEDVESVIIERLPGTRTVMGIECAIIRDTVYVDGDVIEDTYDWFAQDDNGTVWYMGEDVLNYVYDENGELISTNNAGSWEAGLDIASVGSIALPGHQLPASPTLFASYYQEFYEGEAIDMAITEATDVTVELPLGVTLTGCIRTLEWNPLAPEGIETKYYAPGQGLVAGAALHGDAALARYAEFTLDSSALPDFGAATFTASTLIDHPYFPLPMGATWSYESETEEGLETVEVSVVGTPRVVAGVTCVVVHVAEALEGVPQEDTDDWYAQDDAGNVWYMGEAVINYEYDALGNLIDTNTDGSWEAGLDIAGTGANAVAGYLIPAVTTPGASYYQEFYATEAEDVARIVSNGVTVVVGGETYTDCIRTVDWNPLEGSGLEYKIYAPGVGVIMTEGIESGQVTELTDTTL